jgi:hypothetical protein
LKATPAAGGGIEWRERRAATFCIDAVRASILGIDLTRSIDPHQAEPAAPVRR